MYIVVDKSTKKIIHANPAPLSQKLTDKEVYFHFDPSTMQIGKTDSHRIPEHFKINESGEIVELTQEEQAAAGIVGLKVEATTSDQNVTVPPAQKTLVEQVSEGLIELRPDQKIMGEGANQFIGIKPFSQQWDEGLITLEDIKEQSLQRLRQEVETCYSQHKTPNGFRLDHLSRQKASFSYTFRHLPATDPNKKNLLKKKLIYPDNALDEIMAEIEKVQIAYDKVKKDILTAYKKKASLEVFDSISLFKYLKSGDR